MGKKKQSSPLPIMADGSVAESLIGELAKTGEEYFEEQQFEEEEEELKEEVEDLLNDNFD